MKNSSNDLFREYLRNLVDQCPTIYYTENLNSNLVVSERPIFPKAASHVLRLLQSRDKMMSTFAQGIIYTCYIDSYMVLNAKMQESTLTTTDHTVFTTLEDVFLQGNIEFLFSEDLFAHMINYSLEFYTSNIFRKIAIMKKLTNYQDILLNEMIPIFQFDKEKYQFEDGVPIEVITDYYIEQMEIIEEQSNGCEEQFRLIEKVDGNLRREIKGFLLMLGSCDYDCYELLMKQMIAMDYKWMKYILDHNWNLELFNIFNKEDVEMRVEKVEEKSLDDLAEDSFYDSYYLECLIDSVIAIKSDSKFANKRIISGEMVEKHYKKNCSKRVKRKLSMDDNKQNESEKGK